VKVKVREVVPAHRYEDEMGLARVEYSRAGWRVSCMVNDLDYTLPHHRVGPENVGFVVRAALSGVRVV